ncbi:ExeM/NucH family extracellular endonuclease [Brachybacterium sp. JHP9]|uniref:ExeM/NucH family extracellular endonuclease n=1 Tax=Brachybacterium equifaecis TaxID=2910770 RepID=A0ABT0R2H1_9MICO|nr:ExeM/NucH family extracellular endonuclease [Brachybacterium equifaecis]MCL6423100.1 ExeM/NucH family extracellular endonuclease [Brachybacterium equifaecis]
MTIRTLPLRAAALRRLAACAGAAALGATLLPFGMSAALAGPIVPTAVSINEVYGGGGNKGAEFKNDFVELKNSSSAAVSVDGWSLQYFAANGNPGGSVSLTGTIPAGSTYLIQLAAGNEIAKDLPTPDAVGTIAASATNGTFLLSNGTAAIKCTAATCSENPAVLDVVGFGSATVFAGDAAAPALSNSTSASRIAATGSNSQDFAVGAPTPQNSGATPTDPTTPTDPPTPTDPTTPPSASVVSIADIQGTGAASPLAGQTVTTTGVVTAVYATGGLNGYVIQTGGTGGALDFSSHKGSTALFVYSPATVASVQIGQSVKITGAVSEFNGSTQISVARAADFSVLPDALPAVAPSTFTGAFPTDEAARESLEHMLLQPGKGAFTVTDVYGTMNYGEVSLAIGDKPLRQPGDVMRPGPEATAEFNAAAAQVILLDDAKTTNFSRATDEPLSYLSNQEPVRVGAAVEFEKPVIFTTSFNAWRLNPTTPWSSSASDGIAFENTRTSAPDAVGGDLQVGSFNVLNYFTTLGADTTGCTPYTDRAGVGVSVRGGCDLRGAWGQADFERQEKKIVEAISASGMDVVGLMEIENSARLGETPDEATATLVAALNEKDGAGTWDYVRTAPAYAAAGQKGGQDAITSAIIFKPGQVRPVGDAQILIGDPAFDNAREPIGQVFEPISASADGTVSAGEPFFYVVNHFKSKGSKDAEDASLPADPVQGNSRTSRLQQAGALNTWVEGRQSALHVQDVLLVGDFNAYTQEEPLQLFYGKGYTDVSSHFDPEGWSYSYGGMVGSLDHVLASPSALERLTGADDWGINGPESPAFQYSRHNSNVTDLYEGGPFASSDHNPLIVGMKSEITAPPAPFECTFADVPASLQFHDDICWAAEQGYVTGWADGSYRPVSPVNRDAMAAFLYRMAGSPAVDTSGASPFTDIKAGDEHYAAVLWAYQEGITTGWVKADGTREFRPVTPIDRDAMAAFVYRYAGEPAASAPAAGPFSDVPAGLQYAKEIAWLKEQGITTGFPDGSYRPWGPMNRDAMAAFMHRMDTAGIDFVDN